MSLDESRHGWLKKRQRTLHITNHPIDYPDLDPQEMVATYKEWGVTVFTFFAAGYTTMYPSELEWQTPSPHLPEGRDLLREMLEAADAAGLIAVPVIDLGDMPLATGEAHPDWCMQLEDGSLRMKAGKYVVSSPCGPYRRENARELVRELKKRYGKLFKGIKWGGASYGFGGGIDYNPHAVKAFKEWSGRDDLPTDTQDPDYRAWRESVMADNVHNLTAIAHEEGDVPTIGNSIWNLGSGQHFTALASGQDINQLEVQNRYFFQNDDAEPLWERFSTPIETTRYVSGLAQNPPFVVASYFLAWPWRRVAVPWAEQKVYLAQVAANGGSPMVNMTVGAPAHTADKRGFRAIQELYQFLQKNEDCFQDAGSAARVALVYDHESARAARAKGNVHRYYLHEMHATQEALDTLHLPYDILDSENLEKIGEHRYAAILVPTAEKLGAKAVEQLKRLNNAGTGLVLSGSTMQSALAEAFGVAAQGEPQPFTVHDEPGPCQAYIRVAEQPHPILEEIVPPYLAASGHWYSVDPGADATVLATRAAPFRLFPEGVSYPETEDPGDPLVFIARDGPQAGPGRVVCLAFDAGRCTFRTGHPDNDRIIVNALKYAAREDTGISLRGFPDLRVSLRQTSFGRAVHLINTTGRKRFMTQITPLENVTLSIPCPGACKSCAVTLRGVSPQPDWRCDNGVLQIRLPRVEDYEILTIEKVV